MLTCTFDILLGVFNLPVNSLREPPLFPRVRKVKSWYVDYHAGMLLTDKGHHEDLTAPFLVIASVGKQDFEERSIGRYTYDFSVVETFNFANLRQLVAYKDSQQSKESMRWMVNER